MGLFDPPETVNEAAGSAIGSAAGSATGIPGASFIGSWIGGKLGSLFGGGQGRETIAVDIDLRNGIFTYDDAKGANAGEFGKAITDSLNEIVDYFDLKPTKGIELIESNIGSKDTGTFSMYSPGDYPRKAALSGTPYDVQAVVDYGLTINGFDLAKLKSDFLANQAATTAQNTSGNSAVNPENLPTGAASQEEKTSATKFATTQDSNDPYSRLQLASGNTFTLIGAALLGIMLITKGN